MEENLSFRKNDLRAYAKNIRRSFSQEQMRRMDQEILQQFKKIPLQDKDLHYAFIYLPLKHRQEVDTELFIQYLRDQLHPGLEITIPRTHLSDHTMEAVLIDAHIRYTQNSLQLTEPVNGEVIAPEHLDIILLPLLAFDLSGNRIGYGKGFYDRFLAKCRPEVLKIGLSYLPAVHHIDDVDNFDIPLDYCATPERLYAFKNR